MTEVNKLKPGDELIGSYVFIEKAVVEKTENLPGGPNMRIWFVGGTYIDRPKDYDIPVNPQQ